MRSKKLQTMTITLIIIALCITCLSMFMYMISASSIKQEVRNAYNVSLLNTRERIENYFQNINQLTLQFETVPEAERLVQDKVDQTEMATLLKLMTRIHASIDYVDNIAVYNARTREMIATNGAMLVQYDQYEPVIAKFLQMNVSSAFVSMQVKEMPVSVFIRKLPVFSERQTVYMLYHINPALYDTFLGTNTYNKSGSYLIIDEYGQLLASRGVFEDAEVGRWVERINRDVEAAPADPNNRNTSSVFTADDTFVTYLPPSFNGWSYAFAISNKTFLHKAIFLRDVTLKISIALFLAAVVLSFISSHVLWRGWHRLKSWLDTNAAGFEARQGSARNEFDAYLSIVQSVVSQGKDWKRQSDEMLPELKGAIGLSFLENGARAPESLKKMKQYGIPFKENAFCCFCVELDLPQESDYSAWDVAALEYAVVSLMQEVIDEKGYGFAVNTWRSRAAAVISSDDPAAGALEETTRHITRTLHRFIEEHFPVTVSIGVSRIRSDVSHLNVCYSEAHEMLDRKLISGGNQIYEANVPDEEAEAIRFPLREMGSDIFYGIRTRDRELAYKALGPIFELKDKENVHYKWFQSHMVELAQSVYHQFYAYAKGLEVPEPKLDELLQISSLEAWAAWFKRDCIDRLISRLEEQHRTGLAAAAAKLEAHAREHIESDLQIESCCKQLGIPVSFAKQALKEEKGATFNELVLQLRIERAKLWFENEDCSVEEVARRLQYSNAQNFSRMFKKEVGVAPGQYRSAAKALKNG
ncbi:helix-turn-helix domain-containing protein [Paenibacillus ginsengarvi]|nr:helix-turn-helix domain-containing protein [Paenibacillus ginsengarvi]